MPKIKIVTDSTAGLDPKLAQDLQIEVVPLVLRFGSDAFREGIEITSAEFYHRLQIDPEHPTTSQPSPGEFLEVYKSLDEADTIISVHISGALSGTCESATLAADSPELNTEVLVVDSRVAAFGHGHMAVVAAQMAQEGATKDEILDRLNSLITRSKIASAVATLEYLKKGGRIGGAQALLGSLLSFKPVLHVQNGVIEPLGRPRSTKKAVAMILDYIADHTAGKDLEYVGIVHTENESGANHLKEQISAQHKVDNWYLGQLSAVVGVHVGPGVFGACFAAKP